MLDLWIRPYADCDASNRIPTGWRHMTRDNIQNKGESYFLMSSDIIEDELGALQKHLFGEDNVEIKKNWIEVRKNNLTGFVYIMYHARYVDVVIASDSAIISFTDS